MADTPRASTKHKQQKQTLSPAGLTPLVTEDGDSSIIVSDSWPESQEMKQHQKKSENNNVGETGNDPRQGSASQKQHGG